ncbi:helix-turn-helix domain-containing protein [Celeribacter sp.]|uniref:helix-turn-helix domain-containing protein n=1 Tax=Celeribacter sp. TaxID=1890673 RepID=UPI003A93CB2A
MHYDKIVERDAAYAVARAALSHTRPKRLHTQDYHEILWLVNGKARLHLDDGRRVLTEGDLVFMPPDCAHGLQGSGEESHLVNVIVPTSEVVALAARHPIATRFFAARGSAPVIIHRDIRALSRLSSRAVTLESAPRSTLHLEAFLVPLLAELAQEARDLPPNLPDWLAKALIAADDPEVFRDGAAGLVAQCGMTHAHVARTMQAHFGMTPSDYINARRMAFAARQLAGTPDSLSEIATEIGLSNMAHFHRLFRKQFGMTMRQYRIKHQKSVIQPV